MKKKVIKLNERKLRRLVREMLNENDETTSSTSYVMQLIEDTKSGYIQSWKGKEIDVEFIKKRYKLKNYEVNPVLDAYSKSGAKVVWERDVDFTTPITPEKLISLLKEKSKKLKTSYAFSEWSKSNMRRVYVKVFNLGSRTYEDVGYFQSYEGKPWDYNNRSLNNDDFRALSSIVKQQDLMDTKTRKIKHVYINSDFEPPLDMNWLDQQKYLSNNAQSLQTENFSKYKKNLRKIIKRQLM